MLDALNDDPEPPYSPNGNPTIICLDSLNNCDLSFHLIILLIG
jgi:hypothetical protein